MYEIALTEFGIAVDPCKMKKAMYIRKAHVII